MARLMDGAACCDHPHAAGHRAVCSHLWNSKAAAGPCVPAHSFPIDTLKVTAARGPRRSLDLAQARGWGAPAAAAAAPSQPRGPRAGRQRPRQRRFSIAIGESLPLRTIRESRFEDVAALLDSPKGASKARWPCNESSSSSSSSSSISTPAAHQLSREHPSEPSAWAGRVRPSSASGSSSSRPQGAFTPPQVSYAAAPHSSSLGCHPAGALGLQQHLAFSTPAAAAAGRPSLDAPGLDQAGLLALLQHVARHPAQLGQLQDTMQRQRRQSHPPQVLRVHHASDSHSCQPLGFSQEQVWACLQQQRHEHVEAQARWRAQAQRLQQEEEAELAAWQQQEQEWELLQQRLQQLSYSRADGSAVADVQAGQLQRAQQLAAEHAEALLALQDIESELQQLMGMQDRLAAARAIAAPGSRAAMACDAALLQHQAVLQQALAAREEIAGIVLDVAATLSGSRGLAGRQGRAIAQWGTLADVMRACEGEPHLDFGGHEGFRDAPQYPADAESLLQHFGHYAVI